MFWTKSKRSVLFLTMGPLFAVVGVSLGLGKGELPGDARPPGEAAQARDDKPAGKQPEQPAGAKAADGPNADPAHKAGDKPLPPLDNDAKGGHRKNWRSFQNWRFFQGRLVGPAGGNSMLLHFDSDTTIVYADRKKATVADLKPGRWISFKGTKQEPEGVLRDRAELVVLDLPDDGKPQPFRMLFDRHVNFPVNSLTVSRDGKMLATVGVTRRIPAGISNRSRGCRDQPGRARTGMRYSSGQQAGLFAGRQAALRRLRFFVWDVATGKCLKELPGNFCGT